MQCRLLEALSLRYPAFNNNIYVFYSDPHTPSFAIFVADFACFWRIVHSLGSRRIASLKTILYVIQESIQYDAN